MMIICDENCAPAFGQVIAQVLFDKNEKNQHNERNHKQKMVNLNTMLTLSLRVSTAHI